MDHGICIHMAGLFHVEQFLKYKDKGELWIVDGDAAEAIYRG